MFRIILTCLFTGSAWIGHAQADSAGLFLQKGLAEKKAGRLLESYRNFDKAYQYNNKDRQVTQELADALFALKRYPQALEKYKQLTDIGVQEAAVYQKLTELSFNLRQFEDAIRYAQLLHEADPTRKTALLLGKAYLEKEDYGTAIKYLSEAMQEAPADAEVPYHIARAYGDMSNYKQALTFLEKAIALNPSNSRWLYETGLVYYAANDDKNALKYLLHAAEKGYPKNAEYQENLAAAYVANHQYEEGIAVLKAMLQSKPSDMTLLNSMAMACYNAGRYDDAIGNWNRMLELDKEQVSALYMTGMCYQKKGDTAKGKALCDKAIQLDPSLANKRKEKGQHLW